MNHSIYAITSRATGRVYVGKTDNIPHRWSSHRSHLSSGYHHNRELQADVIEHGIDDLSFEVVAEGLSATSAATLELRFIREVERCYNLAGLKGAKKRFSRSAMTITTITTAQLQAIVERLRAGERQLDIARDVQASLPFISAIAVANGLNRRKRGLSQPIEPLLVLAARLGEQQ